MTPMTGFAKHIKPAILLLLLLSIPTCSLLYAQKNGYDTLLNGNGIQKADRLYEWFHVHIRQYDSAHAMQAIDSLRLFSEKANDPMGLAAAAFFRGQYTALRLNHDSLGIRYMEQGIDIAEQHQQTLAAALFRHHLGYYYFFNQKAYATALSYMLRANYTFQETGYDQIPNQGYQLYQLAFVYYHLRNYHEALKYLQTALRYPIYRSVIEIYILHTTGQCFRELYQADSAHHYFLLAHNKALAVKDTAWIGITAGAIGDLYLHSQQYAAAQPFIQDYYTYSVLAKDSACIAEALTSLADIGIAANRHQQVMPLLQQATVIYQARARGGNIQVEDYPRQEYLYNTLARAWEGEGNTSQSLYYRKLADGIRDSLDRRARLSNNTAIQLQLQAEQYNNGIQLLEKEKRTTWLKLYFSIAVIVFMAVIFLLVYNRQLLKRKKDKALQEKTEAILQFERKRAETDLQYARAMLANYTENLRQKTELLDKVQAEIQLVREHQGISLEEEELLLQKLNDASILTEPDWQEFRELFEKVHAGFFVKLKEAYPNLTPAETRLCALTKLKLDTKEMAAMLGVSTDTIKKTRQRLRKKISLPEDSSLESVVDF